jgi:hypothetical protein
MIGMMVHSTIHSIHVLPIKNLLKQYYISNLLMQQKIRLRAAKALAAALGGFFVCLTLRSFSEGGCFVN